MCATCGCGDENGARVGARNAVDAAGESGAGVGKHPGGPHSHSHEHQHDHEHPHGHGHSHEDGAHASDDSELDVPEQDGATRRVELEREVLAKNDTLAERNRQWLTERGVLALNLMSSPGAGKTTLLERTLADSGSSVPLAVIEGDQETLRDSMRLRRAGADVVQINTGAGCHLDAEMVGGAVRALQPAPGSVVLVENVGNLVCPALFDLGEYAKVVIAAVTEGEDKPLKYPNMFAHTDLVLLNKTDLLPHLSFEMDRFAEYARRINPGVEILPVSATTGEGLPAWYDWLAGQVYAPVHQEV
ncbi:Hydrogenase nickel incorporation protein HypB [Actinopolyspora mzabensis]|uniref:Hydrogenase nickel incorporation protein HypB n=1 Tax=Actinopolyspora mzabensis TaxID=995066 RepID=A0A1G8ZQ57_ACTMZ|nr:hydrogenase nickel incorporation protein HypB [Actinopolyspora mzabensis]SDK17181.1 Hydrogenase nickel incorporation protein HypB [Actinopolyspora mzabensis]